MQEGGTLAHSLGGLVHPVLWSEVELAFRNMLAGSGAAPEVFAHPDRVLTEMSSYLAPLCVLFLMAAARPSDNRDASDAATTATANRARNNFSNDILVFPNARQASPARWLLRCRC